MTVHLTDRSRILTGQKCPRERFWTYHYLGSGITKKSKGLPLVVGGAFHEGAEQLLLGKGSDYAVQTAHDFMNKAWAEKGIDLSEEVPTDEAVKYAMAEQNALVEGFLRGWWAWEGEAFLRQYEVIETEQEGRAVLAYHPLPPPEIVNGWEVEHHGQVASIELMYRPDALVRDKESGDYYVVSWKTASTYGKWTTDQLKVEMQPISEVFGVQAVRGIKVEGVLYRHILKGQRRKDTYDNLYKQSSHLIYGWKKLKKGADDETDTWSWAFTYPRDDDPSKNSTLGKGWQKLSIWDNYPGGVKAWIEALAKNEIFPRHGAHPLESVFPQSLPVERRQDEIERWRVQIVNQEHRIKKDLELIGPEPSGMNLDIFFPQSTARCFDFSRPCAMYNVCFTPSVAADPIGSGLYVIRSANHPENIEDDS